LLTSYMMHRRLCLIKRIVLAKHWAVYLLCNKGDVASCNAHPWG